MPLDDLDLITTTTIRIIRAAPMMLAPTIRPVFASEVEDSTYSSSVGENEATETVEPMRSIPGRGDPVARPF